MRLNALHPAVVVVQNEGEFIYAKDYPLYAIKVYYKDGNTYLAMNVIKSGNVKDWVDIGSDGGGSGLDGLVQEIADRNAADAVLQAKIDNAITTEATARTNGDTTERTARESADNALTETITSSIEAERSARTSAINSAKQTLTNEIAAETTARTTADSELSASISNEVTARAEAVNTLNTAISKERIDRVAAINDEVSAREAAITATEGKITAAVAEEATARTAAIDALNEKKSNLLSMTTAEDGTKTPKTSEVSTLGMGSSGDPIVLKSYIDALEARLAVCEEKLIPRYDVKYYDMVGGTLLGTYTYKENAEVTAISDTPSREGYAFLGWDVTFPFTITSDVDVHGRWERNVFTVTFYDYDGGHVLKTEQVMKNQAATAPLNPTRTGYTFNKWSQPFNNVTDDMVIYGEWTVITLTVKFMDGIHTTPLKTETVNYGEDATAPSNPTREGYDFEGWDKEFTHVTTDLTVNAQWQRQSFTVKFYDYVGGSVISNQTIYYGEDAVAPTTPTREGFTFNKWDKSFSDIKANTDVCGEWDVITLTVTFTNGVDGTVLKTTPVNYGEDAIAPSDPTRTGYNFTGWDKEFTHVTEDLTVEAQWAIKTFKVNFYDFNGTGKKLLKSETVDYGTAATAPANPTRTGYTFKKWDKAFDNITADTTVYGEWKIITLTVKFMDGYSEIPLKTETVNYGGSATPPANPTKEGYNFTSWDKSYTNIKVDTVITAQWAIKTFTVKFYDTNETDKTLLNTQTVNYGSDATAPADPTREYYTFTGWDKDFTNVKSNLEVHGEWEEIPVTGPDLGEAWLGHVQATDPATTDRKIIQTITDHPYTGVSTFEGMSYVDGLYPNAYDEDNDVYVLTSEQIEAVADKLLVPAGYTAYMSDANNETAIVFPSDKTLEVWMYDPTTSDYTVRITTDDTGYLVEGTPYSIWLNEVPANYKFIVK